MGGSRLLALLAVMAAGVAFALGSWQYRRLGEQREQTRVALEALSRPAAEAAKAAGWEAAPPDGVAMVEMEGEFAGEALLVRSFHQGSPGYRVVGVFAPVGWERALLVDRGWVPEGFAVGELPAAGPVAGLALALPETEGALLSDGTWRHLSPVAMAGQLGLAAAPWVVVEGLETDFDKAIGEPPVTGWRLPVRATPHSQYALTWFSLGLVALAYGVAVGSGKVGLPKAEG